MQVIPEKRVKKVVKKKRPETMWDDGAWWVFIKGPNLMTPMPYLPGQWVRYKDLCDAFPGFNVIYTPEPDEPQS